MFSVHYIYLITWNKYLDVQIPDVLIKCLIASDNKMMSCSFLFINESSRNSLFFDETLQCNGRLRVISLNCSAKKIRIQKRALRAILRLKNMHWFVNSIYWNSLLTEPSAPTARPPADGSLRSPTPPPPPPLGFGATGANGQTQSGIYYIKYFFNVQ